MSALPPAQPNGGKRDPPPPGARPLNPNRVHKPRPKANALVSRRAGPTRPTSFRPPPQRKGLNQPLDAEKRWAELRAKREANGGWSWVPPQPFTDYEIYTTKKELMDGIRHHVMRFDRKDEEKPVDPTDQEEFPRPVSLHRRDARATQFGRNGSVVKDEEKPENPVDEAEAEKLRLYKEQQEAQKLANLAQIAPVLKKDVGEKPKVEKKQKATSTYYPKHTEEAKKASALRYEETLPWHLEDVDGKNVWVGSYVAALSEHDVAFVIDVEKRGFRMIPVERYYKFRPKRPQNINSLEDAEQEIAKREKGADRWALEDQKRNEIKNEISEYRKFLGGGPKVKMESATSRAIPKAERRDDNDIDLSGDEFQDDDENPGFDADDEDTKETKERLRRDHLGASIFDEVKEKEVEKEEKEAKLEKLRDKLQGKETRKALLKREQKYDYLSDDDDSENPFASSSESESEDEEKEKAKAEEEKKKEEEEKKKAAADKTTASGSNTKGNTTPSGKPKQPDMSKKGKLKRPADVDASETSGNESSRKPKKAKKNLAPGAAGSANASRSGTPLPRRPGGAASDGEGTANEGSDGGKRKPTKVKVKIPGTATGTPAGSRAGSPAPHRAGPAPITGEEIVSAIVSKGGAIGIGDLLKEFKGRVGTGPGQMPKGDWVKLVKNHAIYDKDKMLRPKGAKAAAAPGPAQS
ncbi:hypothetical protein GE09DRAFT_1037707 [Coniochaeta sp. 2T2.1]|nr:hypothetical protein GE09DRAFT_1037707 [Coniochaeta sp. 2T2.1]